MVKLWRLLIAVMAASGLAGCVGPLKQKFEPGNKVCGETPCKALGSVYATSYFQERYLGKVIAGHVIGGALGAVIAQSTPESQNPQNGARTEINAFEKKLGSFETAEHFARSLTVQLSGLQNVKVEVVNEGATKEQIRTLIQAKSGRAPYITDTRTGAQVTNAAAFRVNYGMAARVGNEQIGFRKSYRPFVQVAGQIKHLPTGKLLWADVVLLFGSTRYLGSAADADNVPADELRASLESLSQEAAALLVRSLKGEELPEMPQLADANSADWEF